MKNNIMNEIDENIENLRILLQKNTNDLLNKSKRDFNIFCCCMDAIGDSFQAIDFYIKNGIGSEAGEKYTRLWGLFQAVIIQQDAIIELYKLKNITYALKDGFKTIRNVRNNISGHPTNRQVQFLYFTTRFTMNDDYLDIIYYDKNEGVDEPECVNYREQIFEHLEEFNSCIKELMNLFAECN